jgi:hypothetical protein
MNARRLLYTAAVLLLIATLAACATTGRHASLDRIRSLENIALSPARYPPEVSLHIVSGRTGGAARGTGRGAAEGFFGALETGEPIAILLSPLFALGGGVIGGVYGAAVSESGTVSRASGPVIEETIDRVALQSLLAETIAIDIEMLRGQRPSTLGSSGPASPDEHVDYVEFAGSEHDAILEIALDEIGSIYEWGTPFALSVSAKARLVAVADGKELFKNDYRYVSDRHTLQQWSLNNAALARNTYLSALQWISREVVNDAFPQYWAYVKEIAAYCPNADLGQADAQLRIGAIHYHGAYGSKVDLVRAWVWFSLASGNGNDIARQALEKVEGKLTAAQLEEAQMQLSNWAPGQCMQPR